MYGLVEMEVAEFCISLAHWGLFPYSGPSWATMFFVTWDF